MMAKSSSDVELDFFSMEKQKIKQEPLPLPLPLPPPVFQRRRSFRDIQSVITKINPEVVKSVIGNSSAPTHSHLPDREPKLGVRFGGDDKNGDRAPLTIFYNGVVSVFDVSPRKAHDILKVAEQVLPKSVQNSESNSSTQKNLLESLNGDLPISRKNSLQRFLEKRKERLITVSPYYNPTNSNSVLEPEKKSG